MGRAPRMASALHLPFRLAGADRGADNRSAGMTHQERVAELMVRAQEALRIGMAVLEAKEEPCHCFYPDKSPRWVTADRKTVHHCGQSTHLLH